jgi:hypothetical protein
MYVIIKYRDNKLVNVIENLEYFSYPVDVSNEFEFNVKFGEKVIPFCENCNIKLSENYKQFSFMECITCGYIYTIK